MGRMFRDTNIGRRVSKVERLEFSQLPESDGIMGSRIDYHPGNMDWILAVNFFSLSFTLYRFKLPLSGRHA